MTVEDCIEIISSHMKALADGPQRRDAEMLALFAVKMEISTKLRESGYVSEREIKVRQELIRKFGVMPQ